MDFFKQACWLHCKPIIERYLMSNAHQRYDGTEKAVRHGELCRFYVAVIKGVDDVDLARSAYEQAYQAVHTGTQALTDYLDEVIGFPLESTPDYDSLTPLFFEQFHRLALETLGVGAVNTND